MDFEVRPFLSSGSLWTTHGSYYGYAYHFYGEYKELIKKIEFEEECLRIKGKNDGIPDEYLDGYIGEGVDGLHNDAYRCATSCHLYACMALEGFLNLYGVRRLGEGFYQRNIERLGITEKLAVIGVCCNQWYVDNSSQVVKDFRSLFDIRNGFVHPKTKVYRGDRIGQHLYVHPIDIPISDALLCLERCIDFFCGADESLPRNFLFQK